MPDRAQIEIVRSRQQLAALAPQWRALWRRDPQATPFQSPEWLLPWARQFARRDLRVVTIRRNSRLIGILPLYLYTEPRRHHRQLLFLGAGTSDYLGGVFAPSCPPHLIQDAINALRSDPAWDSVCCTQLRPGSKLLQALDTPRATSPIAASACPSEPCWTLPAATLPNLPPKIRQNARYYRNRAARRGTLTFHTAAVRDCLAAFDTLCRLHSQRWRQSGQPGVLADPRVLAWHREALPLLAHSGLLRLCSLALDGEPIASVYALADPPGRPQRTLYVYLPGFSFHHSDLRPGTLLLAELIERSALAGIRTVDLLRGNESYKQNWHAQPRATAGFTLRIAPPAAASLPHAA